MSSLFSGVRKESIRGEHRAPEKSEIFWGKKPFGRVGMGNKTPVKNGGGDCDKCF